MPAAWDPIPAGRTKQQTAPFGAACCFILKRNGLSRIIKGDYDRGNGIGSERHERGRNRDEDDILQI